MFKILIFLILSHIFFIESKNNNINFDLTVVGSLDFSGSLSRISISVINLLKNDLKINFIHTLQKELKDLDPDIKKVVDQINTVPGNVAFYTDILWHQCPKTGDLFKKTPNSKIKIAYSMLESSAIPPQWVKILNDNFDSVVVPDEFLVEVYKNCGVKIPIFVVPLVLYLEDLLFLPQKRVKNEPFVFGCSAVNWDRKNLTMIINAFYQAFGNNDKIKLKVHTKSSFSLAQISRLVSEKKSKNIQLINKKLSWQEYIEFIGSLDCYVLLSKGEGFSITPREALACGIPCILSNNTGHKSICNSGFVYPVKSEILEFAYYEVFNQVCGLQYNCSVNDAVKAFSDLYQNYDLYLNKAKLGREWVKQYLFANLKNQYLNLIKPKNVILGKENIVTDDYLITDSKKLYDKYLSIK